MNKQEFLSQLQMHICVLQESEQRDILDEYTQHIELQMGKGLSEEGAIRDFGSLDKLAAEILEAYHVNPSFARERVSGKGRIIVILSRIKSLQQKSCSAAGNFFLRIGSSIIHFFHSMTGRLHHLLHLGALAEKPRKERREAAVREKQQPMRILGTAAKKTGSWLGSTIKILLKISWNLLLLMILLPVAGIGMMSILCTGILAALLAAGYPLVGLTLCCLGTVLCGIAVLLFGSILWQRRIGRKAYALSSIEDTMLCTPSAVDMEVHHA